MSERLTDEEFADLFTKWHSDELLADATRKQRAALIELRERRAADLSSAEKDELVKIRGSVMYDWPPGTPQRNALAVLDKLLATHDGGKT